MKLLLTSNGVSNNSIKNSLLRLVDKKPEDISLAFIPTASNVEQGDKGWLINHFLDLKNLNLKSISIVDISAVEKHIWEPQIKEADVLLFGGGNSFHLMEWVNRSGLINMLPELLETKVYVGISAGSMLLSPDLMLDISKVLYKEDLERVDDMQGVNIVDFYVLPHFNSLNYDLRSKDVVFDQTKEIKNKIYAIDDNSAVEFIDGNINIISEGSFLEIN